LSYNPRKRLSHLGAKGVFPRIP